MPIVSPAIRGQRGFTIVELLIVIVVIGVLAAIAVVAYNGIQSRAYDSSVQNDLSVLAKKLELARAETGSYPSSASVQAGILDYRANKSALPTSGSGNRNVGICMVTGTGADRFALFALSKSGSWFSRTSSGQAVQESGGWPASHATFCPSKGISLSESGFYGIWGADNAGPAGVYWYSWVQG